MQNAPKVAKLGEEIQIIECNLNGNTETALIEENGSLLSCNEDESVALTGGITKLVVYLLFKDLWR